MYCVAEKRNVKFIYVFVFTLVHRCIVLKNCRYDYTCRIFRQKKLLPADFQYLGYTGWSNNNRTFLRYHIFAATTDIIMRFLLKCSEITAENNK